MKSGGRHFHTGQDGSSYTFKFLGTSSLKTNTLNSAGSKLVINMGGTEISTKTPVGVFYHS